MAGPDDPTRRVLVAEIGRAIGLKGEVRVHAFTADPAALPAYQPFTDDTGREYRIAAARPGKDHLVVRFVGIADRNAAEALNRVRLHVPRERLPAPDPDEFYLTDLVGLHAFTPEGAAVGRVRAVENHGAGDILDVERVEGPPLLLAFTVANVPVVDVAGGRIVVTPPDEVDAEDEDKPGRRG
jgi:16S rRNA processing protein RimM